MSQPITLNIPDSFFQPIQRVAQATHQPVEQLLLNALQASLPQLDGLPPEIAENLTAMEMLDDVALWQVLREILPAEQAAQLHELLAQRQAVFLTTEEEGKLAQLQRAADLIMLRKARAAVLLRFRGVRVPTLAELEQLSGAIQ